MGKGTGIPWDFFFGTQIPGLGTGIGTDSLWTLWTGTNIAGTVPRQKISETARSQGFGPLGTHVFFRKLKNPGTVPGILGTGTEIVWTVPGF